MTYLLFINFVACLIMTGVIWTVQLVHYPSFEYIDTRNFAAFNRFHQLSISFVVMPAMIIEIMSGAILVILNPSQLYVALFTAILLIWASTFFLSVPLHSKLLEQGFNLQVIKNLVITNWPRTILWSLRSSILVYLIFQQTQHLQG